MGLYLKCGELFREERTRDKFLRRFRQQAWQLLQTHLRGHVPSLPHWMLATHMATSALLVQLRQPIHCTRER
jgi:hypothetical protein